MRWQANRGRGAYSASRGRTRPVAGRGRCTRAAATAPRTPGGAADGALHPQPVDLSAAVPAVRGHGAVHVAAPVIPSLTSAGERRAEIRIGSAERERVVGRLCTAVGEGRLTLGEAEDRQVAAYAARFPRDLAVLVADLPADRPDTAVVDSRGGSQVRLRQALRAVLMINCIALSVGLSAVPGAAGLVALLSSIAMVLTLVAAENIGGLRDRKPGRMTWRRRRPR